MKKLILFAFLMFNGVSYAQNVVIQNNGKTEQSGTKDDTAYYISGISTREDIGGVETTWVYKEGWHVDFKNYNDFPVSVIYEIICDKIGSLVLGTGESKKVYVAYRVEPEDRRVQLIARRLNGKVASVSASTSQSTNQLPVIGGYFVKYPDDLKYYPSSEDEASKILNRLNEQKAYGYDHWRLPSIVEERLMSCSEILFTEGYNRSSKLVPVCNAQNN